MTNKPIDDLEAIRQITEILANFSSEEQERIIRWSREKLGLKSILPPSLSTGANSGGAPHTPVVSIKQFNEEKKPKSDNQFALVAAYYYKFLAPQSERNEFIDGDMLQNATRLANRARLKKPTDTLNNCVKAGSLDRGERGKFSINTVGENLVAMSMPNSDK